MGKNFEGKIGESDILKIPVKDPRTTSTIANYINVILDFTNFNPPYWLRSVASLAGAWIKTNWEKAVEKSRVPRGCVD